MIKVAVSGACGRMGKEVVDAVRNAADMQLVGVIDVINSGKNIGDLVVSNDLETTIKESKCDVVVDFTSPACVFNNAKTILNSGAIPVIGTTGLKKEELQELESLSKILNKGCFIAPNFTTGAVLMMMFAKMASKYFDNAEIIEYHHNRKKDAPSGTAIKTAELMSLNNSDFTKGNEKDTEILQGSRGGIAASNIHIHSVRMPGFMASQEVLFGATGQILSIRHDSVDRKCYMDGVLLAVRYIFDNNKFVYGLDNIL